jgi:predicted GIY-YIG superfamily endonuclease
MKSFVYRCWADDELIYIGVTGNVARRMLQHSEKSEWHSLMTRMTTEPFPLRILAEAAERTAIRVEQPLFNVLGVDGRFNKRMSDDCDVCTFENTVTPHSAHAEFHIDTLKLIRAYEAGEIHGHESLSNGDRKFSIESVLAWAHGETAAVAA